jgi:hypothetical protein
MHTRKLGFEVREFAAHACIQHWEVRRIPHLEYVHGPVRSTLQLLQVGPKNREPHAFGPRVLEWGTMCILVETT